MSGRKPAVAPNKVIDAVLKFKDKIVQIGENGEKKVVVASNHVWNDISEELDYRMSGKAIHTFVFEGRYSIKDKLGLTSISKPMHETNEQNQVFVSDNFISSSSSDEHEMPTKKFVFTFSMEEWKQIQPEEAKYRMIDKSRPLQNSRVYYVLPKSNWTPIMAEHFWEHTNLPCCLSFRRAKVTPNGNNYILVVARCVVCKSNFKGSVKERPSENSRVLMDCIYTGNYDEEHKVRRKRRMIGPMINKFTAAICKEGKSCETVREGEANRLMKIGDFEPSIIPNGNSLRALKSRKTANERRHEDTLSSLVIMQHEENFNNIIHDIGFNPFFVHYHSSEQINIYRQYCKSAKYPKLVLDATGSVVKKFKKMNFEKTKTILLYEGLIYDERKKISFTATNMLTERHTTVAISNWLMNWVNCDVPVPKQTVCDQSLALLSSIIKSFTQYSSIKDYVRACASLLKGEIPQNSNWIPRCFVRIDVAHFIKIVSAWIPLKSVARRVREVILRVMGYLIKCQSFSEIRSILYSLFIVLLSETDGVDIDGEDTPCEVHRRNLISITSHGCMDIGKEVDEPFPDFENDTEENDGEQHTEILDLFENPFQSWANEILNESKQLVLEGSGINPLYLPNLVPIIIKCTKLLPLWSGVMVPIFGYGEEVSNSAAVESSFKKLKTVTFKHIDLPTNLETFLENHIISLKSSSMLRSSQLQTLTTSITLDQMDESNDDHTNQNSYSDLEENQTPELSSDHEENTTPVLFSNYEKSNKDDDELLTSDPEDILYIPQKKYSLCIAGIQPINKGNKCVICMKPIHNLSSCSTQTSKNKNERICLVCSVLEPDALRDENKAEETWGRKNKRQRKNNSYLVPNLYLKYLNLSTSKSRKSLPILKNGSRFEELKGCKTNALPGKVIFNNTCAFDSLTSLIMASYCDNKNYSKLIDLSKKTDFINFVINILMNGVTSATYTKRADLIMKYLNTQIQRMEYDTTLVVCASTIGHVINSMMENYPSANEVANCSVCETPKDRPVIHLTYQINIDNDISQIQSFLDKRLLQDYASCTDGCPGIKTINTCISNMHLFIDILWWEGEEAVSMERSSEAARLLKMKLCDIPQVLTYKNTSYELRGVLSFQRPKSSLRNSIGHYTTYNKRGGGNWELFDDLKKNPVPIRENTVVTIEFLFYTV